MSSDDETDSQTNKRSTRGRGRGRGRPPGRPAKKAKKTKVEKTPKKEIIDSKKVKTEKSYEKSKELDLDLKKDSIDCMLSYIAIIFSIFLTNVCFDLEK